MTHTSVANYPEERRSVGSAINSMAVRFGLAFGVAGYGTLLAIRYQDRIARRWRAVAQDRADAAESLGGRSTWPTAVTSPVWLTPRAMRTCPVSNWCSWSRRWCLYCSRWSWRGLPAHLDVGENKTVEVAS